MFSRFGCRICGVGFGTGRRCGEAPFYGATCGGHSRGGGGCHYRDRGTGTAAYDPTGELFQFYRLLVGISPVDVVGDVVVRAFATPLAAFMVVG